jgi:putative photosynthetic complex assembly protein
MSDPFAERPFPRGALLGAAALIGVTLLAVTAARFSDAGKTSMPAAGAGASRTLHFEDRADGAVVALDAAKNTTVGVYAPGTNGFVRGVLRGLARERRLNAIAAQPPGAQPPFQLTRWSDGRLSLDDPATGRRIDLAAFGPTNAGAFAQLLTAPEQTR